MRPHSASTTKVSEPECGVAVLVMQVINQQRHNQHAEGANRDGHDEEEALPLRCWIDGAGDQSCCAAGLQRQTTNFELGYTVSQLVDEQRLHRQIAPGAWFW